MAYKKRTRTPYKRRPYSRAPRKAYKRRSAKRSPSKRCVCAPTELTSGQKFALAQIDPFNGKTTGAKIPDSNTMPSIATTDTETTSVAVTAGSLSAVAFRPSYTLGTVTATPGIGAVAWAAGFAGAVNRTQRANFNTAVELTRPVAHAVRLVSSLAPTTTTGFVHLGISNETTFNETTWVYPTTVAEMSGLQHYQRITLASLTQTPYVIINKWLDDTGFRYRAPASTLVEQVAPGPAQATFQTDGGWGVIVIMIDGGPASTSALSVEHLLMTESIPQKKGVFHGTTAAQDSPTLMTAASAASANVEVGHSENNQQSYIDDAFRQMARGASAAGRFIAQDVVQNLAFNAGVNMVDYGARAAGLPGINNPGRLVN